MTPLPKGGKSAAERQAARKARVLKEGGKRLPVTLDAEHLEKLQALCDHADGITLQAGMLLAIERAFNRLPAAARGG